MSSKISVSAGARFTDFHLDSIAREVLSELSRHRWDENMLPSTDIRFKKSLSFWGPRYAQILSLLPYADERLRLLEVGIGYGSLVAMIRRLFPSYNIFALEHPSRRYLSSREYREFLKEQNVRLICSDVVADGIPFECCSFDVVTFCDVIEHLPFPPDFALAEIKRVLSPGGYLIISTPNKATLSRRIKFLLGIEINPLPAVGTCYDPYRPHIFEYTQGELVNLVSRHKLRVKRVILHRCGTGYNYIPNYAAIGTFINRANAILSGIFCGLRPAIFLVAQKPAQKG